MLRSMYSGIGGMKNFQIKLDVIGNNIANVNTYGYKKGRTTFKDLVSQQIAGAAAPTGTQGGVNPKQVGLGSQLGSIDSIHTQGSLQTTGRPLDLGISGDGYFMVTDGTSDFYTRSGNFYLDQAGNIVNSDGLRLADIGGNALPVMPPNAESFSIAKNGTVNAIVGGAVVVVGQIGLAKFPNPEGMEKAGDNLYIASANSGVATPGAPGTGGAGSLVSGALEMSNVDLSEEFTDMIVAQRGFQANTRIITTSDEILQELVNLKR
ncbi:flagellar basal body rod protein FlgG [Bacillus luteolus]|uniref:Flagellar hook protein FlgE n=1 Tax=Litchfieldia luteola TaxID=682179 RepID=A0ABR9QJP1_9BACI|nr:flagellar basal body rod protein FlgG [Cytobacillus luteolus]MBE4908723.1 flagellar basal body rod protein FlgG [Cytobacillus luteolus]MBP1941582.1 flagellar hook protein FlgE [Cytobacillus luteolus]